MDAERGKLTEQRQRIIVEALGAGCPKYFAAMKAGVTYGCFKRWMRQGRKEKTGVYRTFFTAVKEAEAECVSRNAELIQHAGAAGTWQAAAWWLERRYPQHFGTQRHELAEMKRRLDEMERDRGQHFGPTQTPAPTRNGATNGHAAH